MNIIARTLNSAQHTPSKRQREKRSLPSVKMCDRSPTVFGGLAVSSCRGVAAVNGGCGCGVVVMLLGGAKVQAVMPVRSSLRGRRHGSGGAIAVYAVMFESTT